MNTFASSLLKPTLSTTTYHQRKQQPLTHIRKPSKPLLLQRDNNNNNKRLPHMRMRQHITMSKTFHNN